MTIPRTGIRYHHGHRPEYWHVLVDMGATTAMTFLMGVAFAKSMWPAVIALGMFAAMGILTTWVDLHDMTWEVIEVSTPEGTESDVRRFNRISDGASSPDRSGR